MAFPAPLPFPPSPPPTPGLRAPLQHPARFAPAINTRRPLNLAGTVAAEDACKRATQDAAAAQRGQARARGGPAGGAARAGAHRGCAGGCVPPRAPTALFLGWVGFAEAPNGRAAGTRVCLLWEKCWRGLPSPRPAATLLSGENDRAQMSLGRCLEGSACGRVER